MKRTGFTLVEMLVIAPIVILAIGSFITAIVSLTGEVLSSRGANTLAFDAQSALNQIEEDIRLSVAFLAVNDKDINTTSMGVNNTTTPFTNLGTTTGSKSLILSSLVTTDNPLSVNARALYLNNSPYPCASLPATEYSKNQPMTLNIVYYTRTESNGEDSLWRRVIMQPDYLASTTYCGSQIPWQKPSCLNDVSVVTPGTGHCLVRDSRLLTGLDPDNGMAIQYYPAAWYPYEIPAAYSTTDSVRKQALAATSSAKITLNMKRTIAGRAITYKAGLTTTRLTTNAAALAYVPEVKDVPAAPTVSGTVSEGRKVTLNWPSAATANTYSVRYRIRDGVTNTLGSWSTTASIGTSRSYQITTANHGDTVQAEVFATNSKGTGTAGTKDVLVPLWAPLALTNEWTEFSGEYSPASYTRTKAGLVMLRGLVKKASAPGAAELIASLPAGYAPAGGRLVFGTTTSGDTSGRVDITATGEVRINNGSNVWFSLETVRYIAADAGYTRSALSLQNGFTNYGNGYASASYVQDSSSRVSVQGLLDNGTRTGETAILTIPSPAQPARQQHQASRSGSGFHYFGVKNTGTLAVKDSSTGVYSINLNFLPASYTNWTNLSLQNGWANDTGTQYPTAQYTKTNDNVVTLRGLVRGGSAAYGTVVTTLPSGFRPKYRILFATINSGAFSRVDIMPNGEVRCTGNTNAWYSLDSITFLAEQ